MGLISPTPACAGGSWTAIDSKYTCTVQGMAAVPLPLAPHLVVELLRLGMPSRVTSEKTRNSKRGAEETHSVS